MVVPYGDPNRAHYRKNALDVGEVGLLPFDPHHPRPAK